MRHEPEPLAQLGFLLGLALRDLVAEHPGPEREAAASRSLQAVGGERLRGAAAAHHRVDPGPGAGHEPESAPHAASSVVGGHRGALARVEVALGGLEVGPALLARPA